LKDHNYNKKTKEEKMEHDCEMNKLHHKQE